MDGSKTSVVMATYNGQKNIVEQLDSLKNQSKSIDQVLIRDDCSTDDTVAIIQEYINANSLNNNWFLKVNKKNIGWRKNFIDLLQEATGEVIFTCDQDDVWHAQKIEKMTDCLMANDEINVLVSNYDELVEPGGLEEELKRIDTLNQEGKKEEKVIFNENNLYLRRPGCVYAIRKKFITNFIQYTKVTKNPVHDQAMWGSALLSDSLFLIREPLISWRKHGLSSFKKEIDFANQENPYFNRLNDLKRRFDRLMGAYQYLQIYSLVTDFKYKERILLESIDELSMRIDILEKKSFISIFISIFKYKRKFYFFSDMLHLYKYKTKYVTNKRIDKKD